MKTAKRRCTCYRS